MCGALWPNVRRLGHRLISRLYTSVLVLGNEVRSTLGIGIVAVVDK